MKKSFTIFICAFGLLAPLGLNAQAQGRNGGGRPQGGFEGRGPEGGGPRGGGMRRAPEKMRLMRTWRGIADLEKSKTPLSKAQAKKVVALVVPATKKQTLSAADATKLDSGLKAVLTSAQKSTLDDDGPFGGPGGGEGRGPGRGEDGPRGDGGGFGRGGDDRGPGGGGFGGRGRGEGGPGGPGGGGPRGGFDGPPPGGGGFGGGGRGFGDMDDNTRQLVGKWMEAYNPFYAPTGYSTWKKLPSEFQDRTAKRYKENRAVLEAISKKSK